MSKHTERKFQFFNNGSRYEFKPNKLVNHMDPKTKQESRKTLLDVHIEECRFRNSPSCYILDDNGKIVEV